MNILFLTSSQLSPIKGGTERITLRLICGLKHKNHVCYSGFSTKLSDNSSSTNICDGEIDISKESLIDFIINHKIRVIIVQKITLYVAFLRKQLEKKHYKCRIISVLHFEVGVEEKIFNIHYCLYNLKNSYSLINKIKSLLMLIIYPIYKILYPFKIVHLYKRVYEISDDVVVFSSNVIDEYQRYACLQDKTKFFVIPNALSYNDYYPAADLDSKNKYILVVSRMCENPKRVSMAIKIWNEIEKDNRFHDWRIKVVGDGPDLVLYRRMAKQMGLKRIDFCGMQSPKQFYIQSRVLLQTSSSEGWGLCLTEAQQFGCVPIAFNTSSSLSEIIKTNENGISITEGDVKGYINALRKLMLNEKLWRKMAIDSILTSKKFDLDTIILNWEKLIL